MTLYGKSKKISKNWRIRREYTKDDSFDQYSYKGGKFIRNLFWIKKNRGANYFKKNRFILK